MNEEAGDKIRVGGKVTVSQEQESPKMGDGRWGGPRLHVRAPRRQGGWY